MKFIFIVNLLLLVLLQAYCGKFYTVEISRVMNTTFYQCYRDTVSKRAIFGVAEYNFNILNVSIQNIYNAKSVGIAVQAVISPCRSRTVQQEIQFINKVFPAYTFERIWINLTPSGATCGWNQSTPASNCQYLKDLIYNMPIGLGAPVSISAMRKDWFLAFKDYKACPEVSEQLLWWTPDNIFDEKPNFDDYIPFGGWKVPFAKIYTGTTVCGGSIYESFYQE